MRTRTLLVPLAATPFLLGAALTGTASAAPAAPALSYAVEAAAPAADLQPDAATALPAVRLAKVGAALQFSRHSIAAARSGSAPAPCTARNAGFVITNGTASRQPLKAAGKPFGVIPAKGKAYVCGFSTRAFSVTFVTTNNPGNKLVARFR